MYVPKPVDTADVTLSPEEGRVKEGWTYGKTRNDELKQHPCLVPYGDLSDSEKEYDRNTAMETLKLIMKLGYKIEKV